ARYGFSLMLAIIGGSIQRFAPFARLFRQALARNGFPERPVGVHCIGHVAATDEQAREEFWPHYADLFSRVAQERGWSAPTRESFDREVGPHGALHVGSPETVAGKIVDTLTKLDASRCDLKYGMGGLSHPKLMTNIELYGTKVAPLVREMRASP
ncbi:MAG: hypothetical protein QOE93_1010, partial [Actinomycetota bacterium]|nr:hypothetical protein [Actinomycetota bacterium]